MSEPSPDKPKPAAVPPTPRLRFRLVHALYAMTLLGSSLAAFGARGIIPALVVLGVWTLAFLSSSRPRALARACLLLLLGFCCVGVLLPAVQPPSRTRPRVSCSNNLKNISLALQNYHDTYGQFPPAYVPDENGKPMHSWRVLILPFMTYRNLYDTYDFDQPWDGPNNRKLAENAPEVYACPTRPASGGQANSHSSYFAVVGPRTVWPGAASRRMKEIESADGTSQTLMVVEAHLPDVAWSEPRDLSLDEGVRLLISKDPPHAGGHVREDFFYAYYDGRNAAMADTSIRFLHQGLSSEAATALLIVDDGDSLREDLSRSGTVSAKRLNLGNCYRLAVFVLLTLFPLPWVWISPRRTDEQKNEEQAADLRS